MKDQRYIALLRGVNVGKAKRIAMADLRRAIEGLGYTRVTTLLNSGNVVFEGPESAPGDIARLLEQTIAVQLQVHSRVTLLSEEEFREIMEDQPLVQLATDNSRCFVSVFQDTGGARLLSPLCAKNWGPEALAVTSRAAHLWCPGGLAQSPLGNEVARILKDSVTTRNRSTMNKLMACLQDP